MGSPSASNGIPNPLPDQATFGKFNNIGFAILYFLSQMQTATLVRVEACSNAGGLSPVGTVDITPLVNQLDGQGNPIPHVTIFNVPYLRMQGGTNAVILDPVAGDIGLAVFASRDVSKIKATKAQGNPGSLRQYDFSDALYVGGMLNGVPTQYVRFSSTGIEIVSPTDLKFRVGSVSIEITEAGAINLISGAASIEVSPSGAVNIVAPGGFHVDPAGASFTLTPEGVASMASAGGGSVSLAPGGLLALAAPGGATLNGEPLSGGGGGGGNFVTGEILEGSGTEWTFANPPIAGSIALYAQQYEDGPFIRISTGVIESITGTIMVTTTPYSATVLMVDYRY